MEENKLPDGDTVSSLSDGTKIYFKSTPMRLYTKWKGHEIDVDLQGKAISSYRVSGNAVYFISFGKEFKAVFTPPSCFAVTFIRFKQKNDSVSRLSPPPYELTNDELKKKTVELKRKIQEYTDIVGLVSYWDDLSAQEAEETLHELCKYKEPLNKIQSELSRLSDRTDIPFARRNNSIFLTAHSSYGDTIIGVTYGDEVILVDNSHLENWMIQDKTGRLGRIPKRIFYSNPGDGDIVARLQREFDILRFMLQNKLRIVLFNLINNQINSAKAWNAKTVRDLVYPNQLFHLTDILSQIRNGICEMESMFGPDNELRRKIPRMVNHVRNIFDEAEEDLEEDVERILEELMNESIFEPEEIEETVKSTHESTLTVEQAQVRMSNQYQEMVIGDKRSHRESVRNHVENKSRKPIGFEKEYISKFLSDFSVTSIRGQGAYGCVFEAFHKLDNWIYAVKRIAVELEHKEKALGEVRALAQLDHPGIVRYNGSWIELPPEGWQRLTDFAMLKDMDLPRNHLKYSMNCTDNCVFIYIQMQLCNYSLSDWLKDNAQSSSRNLPRMKSWFKQVVQAVEYIHRNNLIHRDLKPSNILFLENEVLKLCDLGTATHRRNEEETISHISRTNLEGTLLYMSPEQRLNKHYSSKTDVFSLGLILTELVAVLTTSQRIQIFDKYRIGEQSNVITDPTTANFARLLTQVDPSNRPSSREMLDHLFLA